MSSARQADLLNVLFGFCGQVGVCPGAGTVSVTVWAGSGNPRPGSELRGDCVNTFVKVARLQNAARSRTSQSLILLCGALLPVSPSA